MSHLNDSDQAFEKITEIVGVKVDMLPRATFCGNVHSAHTHRMRHFKIACIILEHSSAGRCQTVPRKDSLEGHPVRFGMIARMFHAVYRIEKPAEAARGKHPFGIGRAAVGINDTPSRQSADALRQYRIRAQPVHRDVVHIVQVRIGVNVMLAHQPRERGAVPGPVEFAQPVRLCVIHAERLHHPCGHPHFDEIEKTSLGRVKRVVEIKDPVGNMCKGSCRHRVVVRTGACERKPRLLPVRRARH